MNKAANRKRKTVTMQTERLIKMDRKVSHEENSHSQEKDCDNADRKIEKDGQKGQC